MSSSISSLSSAQAGAVSTYQNNTLSAATKQKLEALGIDPSSVTSEAQAQALISQAEATQHQQNANSENNGGGNSSEQELMSEAKSLATAVGASVSSDDTLDDIINNIDTKIQAMLNSGDENQFKLAQGYQSQLASLSERADTVTSTQNNIFNAMNMVSVSNKYALGL
ncbi:unknown [Clostridium sp. CAG:967]|nr:unknown [Clostridium sp. CAG:967]